ncbi:MAG: sulfite exporter TauE/SafE family protein [Clostridium sp.]|nr:sulfite exporter TauE/SafE family protein [Clostridium sp.]
MTNYILFLVILFVSHTIHGITGFAGAALALSPSLMLVDYNVAKPIINVLGLLAGIYVFVGSRKDIDWKELKKIVIVMAVGIVGGIMIRGFFAGKDQVLYKLLGVFVIFLSLQGAVTMWKSREGAAKPAAEESADTESGKKTGSGMSLLVLAGIIHGLFVSGGPLLIGYLTKRIKDKACFRATIATVWVFLNGMILVDDIRAGLWTPELIRLQLISVPLLVAAMYLGGKLCERMSQRLFMIITYVLLFISGITLLLK